MFKEEVYMSKFCTNCGSQGEDNANVCTNCGKPFDNVNGQNQMPQATPMPNYGGMPQATPMPNYGGMPQATPMPNQGGSILDKGNKLKKEDTASVATMPSNDNMPPQGVMPNAGNMPPQGVMPNAGNMPPQGAIPNAGNMPPQGAMPNAGAMQANNGNNKKTFAIIGIVVGAVVVLAIVVALVFGLAGSGYESVIDQKLKAIEKLDAEKLAETYPDFIYSEDCETFEEVVDDVEDDIIPAVEECLDVIEDEAGKNVKFSYKVEEVTDLTDSRLEKFCAGVEDCHDYDASKIKDIKKATINVTAKGDDGKYEFDWEDVYLIKENGNWYIMNTDFELDSFDDHNDYLHIDYYEYYKEMAPDSDEDSEEEAEDDGDLLY